MKTIVGITDPSLSRPLEAAFRLSWRQRAALRKLGIKTVRDLLFHFPARYEDLGGVRRIGELRTGERATVVAEVVGTKAEKTWRRKLNVANAVVRDETGVLNVVWFNQPYMASILKPGMRVRLSGRATQTKRGLSFANPLFEPEDQYGGAIPASGLVPVYPETYGITSRWFRYQVKRLLDGDPLLPEVIPATILEKYRLPSTLRAMRAMHYPKTVAEAEAARKRFAFEEILTIQLDRQRARRELESLPSFRIAPDEKLLSSFRALLPFALTNAQEHALQDILRDFTKPHPMARLLEGDVGSGKTLVAAAAALQVVGAGYQVAYLAPTEILARQHLDEFIQRLTPFRTRIGLLTGSEARRFPSKVRPQESAHIPRSQLIRGCLSGDIQILIGTHALIEERVRFKKLALAIVDEQHRFGVEQRRAATKEARPHFLSMSATPIPRTLALTIYGDLDLTILDELPPGRMPVETRIVARREREATYAFIREEVHRGGQVFVICPRIEAKGLDAGSQLPATSYQRHTDWGDVKSVKAEFKKLSAEIFPDLRVGVVHGKLKPKEKDAVMRKFRRHELDILVSTSVVEVGVDVPNASIMMIEGGERFGLAQLHQFRGRVGRGSRKSYCFVCTTSDEHAPSRRLKALQEAKTGFALAEYDLQFRGPGELSGKKQWGVSDVGMEALKNLKMVEAARAEAQALIAEDPELKKHPLLAERVRTAAGGLHFE